MIMAPVAHTLRHDVLFVTTFELLIETDLCKSIFTVLFISSSIDESLTVANVVSVLSKMRERVNEGGILGDNLSNHLSVPWFERARSEISLQHRTLQDQHAALAQYLLYSLPGFSWATFAGALYYRKEGAALQEARRYINREEGELLCVAVIDVHDSIKTSSFVMCVFQLPPLMHVGCGMVEFV